MTLDLRPGKLDLFVYPGNDHVITITWPSSIAGRTFSASLVDGNGLNPVALTVAIDVAVMTVTFSDTATNAVVSASSWRLTETTAAGPQVVITGLVQARSGGSGGQGTAATVRLATGAVAVTVTGNTGAGVPTGGTAGQALVKTTGVDFATSWVDIGTQIELDAEAAARIAADTAEATTRAAAVTAEATARASADSALSSSIASEASTRATADTTEATARATADNLKLAKASNLSDLADIPTARANLIPTGTYAKTVGYDIRDWAPNFDPEQAGDWIEGTIAAIEADFPATTESAQGSALILPASPDGGFLEVDRTIRLRRQIEVRGVESGGGWFSATKLRFPSGVVGFLGHRPLTAPGYATEGRGDWSTIRNMGLYWPSRQATLRSFQGTVSPGSDLIENLDNNFTAADLNRRITVYALFGGAYPFRAEIVELLDTNTARLSWTLPADIGFAATNVAVTVSDYFRNGTLSVTAAQTDIPAPAGLTFDSDDLYKHIVFRGAGTAGADHEAIITAFNSGNGHVTIHLPIVTTKANAQVVVRGDGILQRCHGMIVKSVFIDGPSGEGIANLSHIGNENFTVNANNSTYERISAYHCFGSGIWFKGGDSNQARTRDCDLTSNDQWALRDDSFLGNHHIGHHTSTNARGGYTRLVGAVPSKFEGCYAEADQPQNDFAAPTTWVFPGAVGNGFTPRSYDWMGDLESISSPAGLQTSGQFRVRNSRGRSVIDSDLGQGDDEMTAQRIRSHDDPAALRLLYEYLGARVGWWAWTHDFSSNLAKTPLLLSDATAGDGAGLAWLRLGYFLGTENNGATDNRILVQSAQAEPTSGRFSKGDVVECADAAALGVDRWRVASVARTVLAFATGQFTEGDTTVPIASNIDVLEVGDMLYGSYGGSLNWIESIGVSSIELAKPAAATSPPGTFLILAKVTGKAHLASTGTTTNASDQVTGVTNPSTWANGDYISGTGVPVNTKVLSGGGTATLTLTNNATASGSTALRDVVFTPSYLSPVSLVQDEGVALTRRPTVNFVGAGVEATDDSANNRTLVTIAGGGGGGGGGSWGIRRPGRVGGSYPDTGITDSLDNGVGAGAMGIDQLTLGIWESPPGGMTIGALHLEVTTGLATASFVPVVYVIDDQDDPVNAVAGVAYATLLTTMAAIDCSTTGHKNPVVSEVIPAGFFLIGGVMQGADASVMRGSAAYKASTVWGNLGVAFASYPLGWVYKSGVSGAPPASFVPTGLAFFGPGMGFTRSA